MNLRETAERIIEGIPQSYRDGDEEAGHEGTARWLMDLLKEFAGRNSCEASDQSIWLSFYPNGTIEAYRSYGEAAENAGDSYPPKIVEFRAAEHAASDTKRLAEIRELWQRGMPNFKTACVEFSFEVAGKIDAILTSRFARPLTPR